MLEIQELINAEKNDRCLEILYTLKKINKQAFLYMRKFGKRWRLKYREMWKEAFWKKGRLLLKEYFQLKENMTCSVCGKQVGRSFILHHDKKYYNSLNLFTPLYVKILCSKQCHTKKHRA